uniref:Uncharacterized protein n=1 Tax=Daucus carota subsp. sativus TaxID=79200 RepID=A0A161X595_DAUCS
MPCRVKYVMNFGMISICPMVKINLQMNNMMKQSTDQGLTLAWAWTRSSQARLYNPTTFCNSRRTCSTSA